MIEAVLIGISSSILASAITILIMSNLRPRIEIISSIAKDTALDQRPYYAIKVLNKGRRDVVHVKAELMLMNEREVGGKNIHITQEIGLTKPDILTIRRYQKGGKSFSYRFSTYEDLDEKWPDDSTSYLRFRIYAVDSLSGFGKVFTQRFKGKKRSILSGRFAGADSGEIY